MTCQKSITHNSQLFLILSCKPKQINLSHDHSMKKTHRTKEYPRSFLLWYTNESIRQRSHREHSERGGKASEVIGSTSNFSHSSRPIRSGAPYWREGRGEQLCLSLRCYGVSSKSIWSILKDFFFSFFKIKENFDPVWRARPPPQTNDCCRS